MEIKLLSKGENRVFYTSKFEREVLKLRDKKSQKKVLSWLKRLESGFPSQPEKWKPLEGEDCQRVFELKPKPYRVCCLVVGRDILAINLWRIQKNRGRAKSKEIENCCKKAREVEDDFKRFIKRV